MIILGAKYKFTELEYSRLDRGRDSNNVIEELTKIRDKS